MPIPTFQEQQMKDLDEVFFSVATMEFIEEHELAGIRGDKASLTFKVNVIVDRERYMEQRISARSENVDLNGLLFFIKKSDWPKGLAYPKVRGALLFDRKQYIIESVIEDMGVLEVALTIHKGIPGGR